MARTQLKEVRSEQGVTQSELADEIGVHPTTISKWENRGIPDDRLQEAAEILGVKKAALLAKEPESAQSGAHVTGRRDLERWRDEVASAEFGASAKVTAMSLTYFVDEVSWVCVVSHEAMAQFSQRSIEQVEEGWGEVVESDFVERVQPEVKHAGRVDVRWVFRLTFPDQ